MKNHGLFSTFFINVVQSKITLDDQARGRMATLSQTWRDHDAKNREGLWDTFVKQAVSYIQFVPPAGVTVPGVYPLYEDYSYSQVITVLYLTPPDADLNDTAVGRFWPAKLLAALGQHRLTWGILTDGAVWRLYSNKSSRPYEDYVELNLAEALEQADEGEYGLFERFFHKESFEREEVDQPDEEVDQDKTTGIFKCRLDHDREASEKILGEKVKAPLLYQVDEILRYLCNGFITETPRQGAEYTDEERQEIFASAVRLVYRCLFLFYAESRSLLPSELGKAEVYAKHSIRTLCQEARRLHWGQRQDVEGYDLWQHLQGLIHAVHDGDPEYGILGYNGGLFDDYEVKFLGRQRLRNDFLSRALYLLAYVEPLDGEPDHEYAIPYEDLEVRHLGELYENILDFNVMLAEVDLIRRRTKKGVETLPASATTRQQGDRDIKKGDVYFGESALERKQTGSFYTPEPLVHFLNLKAIIEPLRQKFIQDYQSRFAEFLEQAQAGVEASTRRGALQAAVALVERFVKEAVLEFKVCDPAMGSGHFLVNAANQMSGLVVELLAALPDLEGLAPRINSDINSWRRRITRHCLYGVDLNPLAVDLAKLSLWLNGFAREHKLTFLDHHLRCGNSLIGIRSLSQLKTIPQRKKDKKKESHPSLPNFESLSLTLAELAQESQALGALDEDETERQKAVLVGVQDTKATKLMPVPDLFTAYLMDGGIIPLTYQEIYQALMEGQTESLRQNPNLVNIWRDVKFYRQRHQFFHWPLEFPEIFGPSKQGGFQATVGNPPWDIIKPNSQEFFSAYDPEFRRYNKQEANRVAARLMKDNEAIRQRWADYTHFFAEQSVYVREPASFGALGSGDINTYKLFLERFFTLLRPKGRLGIVVPSGLYTDQGCLPLRQMFFHLSQIDFLYCFENRWPTVFPAVDGRFKFVIFSTEKGGETESFKCAFMKHDPERLQEIESNAIIMTINNVKKLSPINMSLVEFKDNQHIKIDNNIYDLFLNEQSSLDSIALNITTEFHITNNSNLFKPTKDLIKIGAKQLLNHYWYCGQFMFDFDSIAPIINFIKQHKESAIQLFLPVWEGKNIWQYDPCVGQPSFWIDWEMGINHLEGKISQSVIRSYFVGYREIAASTNERTMICSILPPFIFTNHKLPILTRPLAPKEICYVIAIFNSFVFDFLLRPRTTTSIGIYTLKQIPIPKIPNKSTENHAFDFIKRQIIMRVARLMCKNEMYSMLWNNVFSEEWNKEESWYPKHGAILYNYGPKHEQKIRERILEDAKGLTEEWEFKYAVHDCQNDNRDSGDRAQLRAEIDACVAHLYGLNRNDFGYILDSFPVLKRKEEKAFGEFMSKRKCLEEYDRLATIL